MVVHSYCNTYTHVPTNTIYTSNNSLCTCLYALQMNTHSMVLTIAKKEARKFNLEEIFQEAQRTAKERNKGKFLLLHVCK